MLLPGPPIPSHVCKHCARRDISGAEACARPDDRIENDVLIDSYFRSIGPLRWGVMGVEQSKLARQPAHGQDDEKKGQGKYLGGGNCGGGSRDGGSNGVGAVGILRRNQRLASSLDWDGEQQLAIGS